MGKNNDNNINKHIIFCPTQIWVIKLQSLVFCHHSAAFHLRLSHWFYLFKSLILKLQTSWKTRQVFQEFSPSGLLCFCDRTESTIKKKESNQHLDNYSVILKARRLQLIFEIKKVILNLELYPNYITINSEERKK